MYNIRYACTIRDKRRTIPFDSMLRVSGYQGIVLARASFEQGSSVKLPMFVVRRRFGTSTPDIFHRCLKILSNRFEMPAVAVI